MRSGAERICGCVGAIQKKRSVGFLSDSALEKQRKKKRIGVSSRFCQAEEELGGGSDVHMSKPRHGIGQEAAESVRIGLAFEVDAERFGCRLEGFEIVGTEGGSRWQATGARP